MSAMRRLVPALLFVATLIAVGCSSQAPHPHSTPSSGTLSGAMTNPSAPETSTVVQNMAPHPSKGYQYRFRMTSPTNDNNAITEREVYLWFWPDTTRIWFRLENRIGTAIKIQWNDMRFYNTDGQVFKTIHEGVTYDRRNEPQDFTQVYGQQRYNGWVAPVDLMEDPSAAQGNGMRLLFPTDQLAIGYMNKSFRLDFVLEIDGQPRVYSLVFHIDNVLSPS